MSEAIDIQEGFALVVRTQAELHEAIISIGSFLCARVIEGDDDRDEVIERLESLADEAGTRLAEACGGDAIPNRHLLAIANRLYASGRGLHLVRGGEDDDPTAA
jgi:hypothetical protein